MRRRKPEHPPEPVFVSAYPNPKKAKNKKQTFSIVSRLWSFFKHILVWGFLAIFLLQGWFLAHILWWRTTPPPSTAFMRQRAAETPGLRIQYNWVPYQHISPHLKRALIAAEDARFLSHQGFDWNGIRQAYEKNQRRGHISAGGSTISQQLAKNLFLSSDKNFFRKAQEAVITVMLENLWSKTRILEVYANVIEWGDGIFGAEAAAQYYFETSADHLTPYQAAKLAAMVPRPRYYQKRPDSSYLQHRTATVRARLADASLP